MERNLKAPRHMKNRFARFEQKYLIDSHAMKNGFAGQIKQRDLKFPIIHCIIHQELSRYAGKSLNYVVQCKPSLK